MTYRIDFTRLNHTPSHSRFGLTLHNITENTLNDWRLHFVLCRQILPDTLLNATLKQNGNYCIITPPNIPLQANSSYYFEFEVGTQPFELYDDGIPEAFISCGQTSEITPITINVSRMDLGIIDTQKQRDPLPKKQKINLVPYPNCLEDLEQTRNTCMPLMISQVPDLAQSAIAWLQQRWHEKTQKTLAIHPKGHIHYRVRPQLNEESYRLLIEEQDIWLEASTHQGFCRATATLLQLFEDHDDALPMLNIEDHPNYGYRGMMLDCARHFHPVERILLLLEQMAYYKFNTFHWHLTDDEAWRIEIDAFPQLTDIGAWRGPNEVLIPQFSHINQTYGGFYRKAEIRQVIEFAAQRGIEVIPEIDMPGHCRAAIHSLPELLQDVNDRSVYLSIQGFHDNVLSPALESTYHFIQTVLEEVADLFPAPYLHVGGDEVPKGVWTNSPACQQLMAHHGYTDPKMLQGHLLSFAETVIKNKGKRMMGWEEARQGNQISRDTIIFSWLSEEAGKECAEAGFNVVMQPAQYTYLDLAQAPSADEWGVNWAGYLPLKQVYDYQPLASVPVDDPKHEKILGIQSALWSELINSSERFDYMIYPRLLAVAEIAWTTPTHRQWDAFRSRLNGQLHYLDRAGIHYRRCE